MGDLNILKTITLLLFNTGTWNIVCKPHNVLILEETSSNNCCKKLHVELKHLYNQTIMKT